MNNKIFLGLLVVAAGVLAGWYFLRGTGPAMTPSESMTTSPTPAGSNLGAPPATNETGTSGLEKGGVMQRTVVTLSDSGFAPQTVSVKAGDTITFVNESSGQMWVASDPHPVHTLLSGFDELTSVGKGGTYEYTFAKVGTWTYHNHVNPSVKGTVKVTE